MADIQVFDVTDGAYDDAAVNAIAGATSGTIPWDANKMRHAAMRVSNGGGQAATVTIKAGATPGVHGALGDATFAVANGHVQYIPLGDSARFLNLADKDVDYEMSTTGTTASVLMEVATI